MKITLKTQNNSAYKTRQEIAVEYSISVKTLLKKLKAKGLELPPGRVSLILAEKDIQGAWLSALHLKKMIIKTFEFGKNPKLPKTSQNFPKFPIQVFT